MGYMHIDNLYRDDRIFQFDECFALEKIHGTSAHISFDVATRELTFFSGGEPHQRFVDLFDQEALKRQFDVVVGRMDPLNGVKRITVFGEAYGGKQQAMSATYGPNLKFIVFDVALGEDNQGRRIFVDVLSAHAIAQLLGLEFVDYVRIPTKLHLIDAERDKPSTQAQRNGITEPKRREGVVLRPIDEVRDARGNRIITKHKGLEFSETKTFREVDPNRLKVLADANKIADEWVTEMRLAHVVDKLQAQKMNTMAEMGNSLPDIEAFGPLDIKDTGTVVSAMIEDVKREAAGEIVESKDAMKAIGSATARLYKKWLQERAAQQLSVKER